MLTKTTLLALISCAAAAASAPSAQTALTTNGSKKDGVPQVWPPPQQISRNGCGIKLDGDVTIVTGSANDTATVEVIKSIVQAAGGRATVAAKSTGAGVQILLGTDAENADAAAAAKALGGGSAANLTAEGYVLATGKYSGQQSVVLNGVDVRGTFYAAQTLRQLSEGKKGVPGVQVRDWPLMPIRGSIEGFYGIPWSHQARLDQYVLYGKHKLNTYVYTPKGDNLLRATWRQLYSGDDLKQLQELVDTANANHVDFTFALSPGLDLCYSSDADFNATVKKFDQVRGLGVRSFYIALDDIPLKFHCDEDKKRWPDKGDYHWLADSQTYYLNRIQKEYVEKYGLIDLETVPTNYAGSAPDPYKGEFGKQLNKKIRVQWTGEGVFSDAVTSESVVRADSTYVTDKLFIWDNFPVNDNKPFRLFLNPLTKRALDLYKHLIGFTANPMVQSYASMPSLINYADYTWNGPAYNPDASMAAGLQELAGPDDKAHTALLAFSDINQNWPYRNDTVNAPELSKAIDAFWAARKSGDKNGRQALVDRLALINTLPDVLPTIAMKAFGAEVAPWSTLAMQWATASQHVIAMIDAVDAGDKAKADQEHEVVLAWVEKTKAKTVSSLSEDGTKIVPNSITPTTGDAVFDKFVADGNAIYKAT